MDAFDVAERQIIENKKKVDFDIKEFTIEFLVNKFDSGEFYVPDYQRDFVWSLDRRSKFIESVILGLPIPFIFVADVADTGEEGNFEIVDGSQRIRTLSSFMKNEFPLQKLDILTEINRLYYRDLSPMRQKRFGNTSLKMIVISEQSDPDVRFMMFERINTGSDELNSMERRRGINRGVFTDFIYNACATHPLFKELTAFTDKVAKRGEAEELILRYFAYCERYDKATDSPSKFLDDYMKEKNEGFSEQDRAVYLDKFLGMLTFVKAHFSFGFRTFKESNKTPRVRFEAISVGVSLALDENPNLNVLNVDWIDSDAFISETTGSSTGSPSKIKSRIEFVKNKLLSSQ
jgi:Protein of unknown function DUF262